MVFVLTHEGMESWAMRVAALYDIHANLLSLEAVLQEMRDVEVDEVVIGGDIVPGPMQRETLARLFDLDVPAHFIYGNGEPAPEYACETRYPQTDFAEQILQPASEGAMLELFTRISF